MILRIEGVTKRFGGLTAVNRCSMSLKEGEIYGLIGPNGSGKTTLFNLVTGFLKPNEGEIYFKNERITGLNPLRIVKKGVARTFQITRVFRDMTVLENLRAAAGRWDEKERKRAQELLEFTGLAEFKNELARNLNPPQQKKLEIIRVLMLDPQLLLLDEPTSGLDVESARKLLDYIQKINELGKTIWIIEHNMNVIMNICRFIYVLDHGEKIAEGSPEKIKNDERVIKAYLGY